MPAAVVLAPGPDDAIQQEYVQVLERSLPLGDAPAEAFLDRQAVVNDAAGTLGVFDGALLVADDPQHRVAGFPVVWREHARAGQLLGQLLGEVVVGVQRAKAVPNDDVHVGPLAEPVGDGVGVRGGRRGAVQRDLPDHVGRSVTDG